MAILYLLQYPDLKVEGITVIGTGMANLGPGTAHALGLIALAGEPDIPVSPWRYSSYQQREHCFDPTQLA